MIEDINNIVASSAKQMTERLQGGGKKFISNDDLVSIFDKMAKSHKIVEETTTRVLEVKKGILHKTDDDTFEEEDQVAITGGSEDPYRPDTFKLREHELFDALLACMENHSETQHVGKINIDEDVLWRAAQVSAYTYLEHDVSMRCCHAVIVNGISSLNNCLKPLQKNDLRLPRLCHLFILPRPTNAPSPLYMIQFVVGRFGNPIKAKHFATNFADSAPAMNGGLKQATAGTLMGSRLAAKLDEPTSNKAVGWGERGGNSDDHFDEDSSSMVSDDGGVTLEVRANPMKEAAYIEMTPSSAQQGGTETKAGDSMVSVQELDFVRLSTGF